MRLNLNTRRPSKARRFVLTLIAAAPLLGMQSCDSVKFYEKQLLADPIMEFGDSATESHFISKSIYSREASVGGIGSSAGGGCGCY